MWVITYVHRDVHKAKLMFPPFFVSNLFLDLIWIRILDYTCIFTGKEFPSLKHNVLPWNKLWTNILHKKMMNIHILTPSAFFLWNPLANLTKFRTVIGTCSPNNAMAILPL